VDRHQALATENFTTLDAMLGAPCIARLPWSDTPSAQFAAAHIDLGALSMGAADRG
jgi:hypothetical protein